MNYRSLLWMRPTKRSIGREERALRHLGSVRITRQEMPPTPLAQVVYTVHGGPTGAVFFDVEDVAGTDSLLAIALRQRGWNTLAYHTRGNWISYQPDLRQDLVEEGERELPQHVQGFMRECEMIVYSSTWGLPPHKLLELRPYEDINGIRDDRLVVVWHKGTGYRTNTRWWNQQLRHYKREGYNTVAVVSTPDMLRLGEDNTYIPDPINTPMLDQIARHTSPPRVPIVVYSMTQSTRPEPDMWAEIERRVRDLLGGAILFLPVSGVPWPMHARLVARATATVGKILPRGLECDQPTKTPLRCYGLGGLESMYLGVPHISSIDPETKETLRDVLGEAPPIFDAYTPRHVADRIVEIVRGGVELRRDWGVEARGFVERHHRPGVVAAVWERFFKEHTP